MADENKNDAASRAFFEAGRKPSKLKTAFQYAGAALGTISGDGATYGWNQAGATYDYAKTWLGSKGLSFGGA